LSTDPHDLDRFTSAQEEAYDHALAELRDGSPFDRVLDKFFESEHDPSTTSLLEQAGARQ
jgi:uncharacterized protein (DUF1810 family)